MKFKKLNKNKNLLYISFFMKFVKKKKKGCSRFFLLFDWQHTKLFISYSYREL